MLHVHRSERADRLAAGLAEVLADPPDDPFTADVVAVPARGVERWLAQRLSGLLGADPSAADDPGGVCAHVQFPSPSQVISQALAAVTGVPAAQDPWHPERLTWRLLSVVDECAGEPWCDALGRHLGVPGAQAVARGRRLATAAHLASLFAGYAANRPGMLLDWAAGDDTDGAGSAIPDDLRWQAELWRRARAELSVPSAPERLAEACDLLRERPDAVALPDRLSIFGATRLSTEALTVLGALAERRQVHLWLAHPSRVLWDRLQAVAAPAPRSAAAAFAARGRRAGLRPDAAGSPLLASLGRDVRELQLTLAAIDAPRQDEHLPGPPPPPTLLGRVQQHLRDDAAPDVPPGPIAADDRSLQVHACHGRARQVEVLREVVLGLLEADPTLELRDVIVLCPDIDSFAPLISAFFGAAANETTADGAGWGHPGQALRVRLADRSLRETNPFLATLATLLELADGRVTASQVLDLAAAPPVRRRFRLDDDDLQRWNDWVRGSGVRWGLDRRARAPFGLPTVGQNTWEAGLDRLLLGAAMADDEHWLGLALPLDDVDSSEIDLAGRLAELTDRLADLLARLSGSHPLAHWLDTLDDALDGLTDVDPAQAWQLDAARRQLAAVAQAAGTAETGAQETSAGPPLSLGDVRALLAGRLIGVPTRAGFRTGNLTMCTMVPMRSVPHRVVCLLGLDDGAFPRAGAVDGDDILLRDPCIGERDLRSEDRQLLLDAIAAAGENLVVLYSGAHERTNARQPPAVPVGELLDVLDRLALGPDQGPVRDHVVVRHPLQPFDARNFVAGRLGGVGRPFSFDRAALAGARAAAGPRAAPSDFLPTPLPPPVDGPDSSVIELDDLIAFLEHPVRYFVRRRLGVRVPDEGDEPADALCVELTGLERWQVGERMLTARLSGVAAEDCEKSEWRRGLLPPGPLGVRALAGIRDDVGPLVAAAAPYLELPATSVTVSLALPDGRTLEGTLSGVRPGSGELPSTLLRTTYSRLGPRQRLRAWAGVLALSAARPESRWQAVTIGRAGGPNQRARRTTFGGIASGPALNLLMHLVELRDRGLQGPLPCPPACAAAYAAVRNGGGTAQEALERAQKEWTSGFEATDAEYALVWGPEPEFDAVTGSAPFDDENWQQGEARRFGQLACRIWLPLLDAESTELR